MRRRLPKLSYVDFVDSINKNFCFLLAKKLSIFVALIGLTSTVMAFEKKFVIVGVSGFKTIKAENTNIFNDSLAPNGQESGVWSNLPKDDSAIRARVFLTHYARRSELSEVISLLQKTDGSCDSSIGLIVLSNSWGARKANTLGHMYYEKCNKMVDLFFVIDGIVKPVVASFRDEIWASKCINFYQSRSNLHGTAIRGCENHLLDYSDQPKSMYRSHIQAEWDGSAEAAKIIKDYLNSQRPQ